MSNVSTLNLGTLRVPVYHQLPASSLLNRQHATALGLGKLTSELLMSTQTGCLCFDVLNLYSCVNVTGAAIRSGATVEKAVQTIGMERYRRPWPPSQEQWERRRPQVRKRARPQARREMPWLGGPVMTSKHLIMQSRWLAKVTVCDTKVGLNVLMLKVQVGQVPDRKVLSNDIIMTIAHPEEYKVTFFYAILGSRWYSNRKGHVGANASRPLKFDTDFDFDSSNAQFIKELEREVQAQGKGWYFVLNSVVYQVNVG